MIMIDKTDDFMNQSEAWRISAVIHDGSWYTLKKWAKFAKVKKQVLNDWLKNNKDKVNLINIDESYRVDYEEILKWYKNQPNITIHDRIVPNNFPPKIWDNQTEVEALINTPRRKVTEVTITPDSRKLLDKCRNVLKGTAIVRFYRNGTYRACGLSPNFIEQTLRHGLTQKEFSIVNPGRKTIMRYRELSDFSPEFLNNILKFYIPFARTMLRSRMSTLKIYLPTKNDIDMQIAMWVMVALRKFDETQPVPFSGYLNRVLAFWPYDLPDEALGKELSGFQRNRQKVINKLVRNNNDMVIPDDMIIKEMNIDKEKYLQLSKEYHSWLAEHNASQITWDNSSNEKEGARLWAGTQVDNNPVLSHKISLGICNAALKTNNFHQALKLMSTIGSVNSDDYSSLSKTPDDFKQILWDSVKEELKVSDEQ